MGVGDEHISDTQPFIGTKSCDEYNTTDARNSENDELALARSSALIDPAHNALRQKDAGWAIAFKVNVGITVIFALYFGHTGLNGWGTGAFLKGRRLEYQEEDVSWLLYALMVVCSVIISWALSCALLKMMIKFPRFVVEAGYLSWAAVCFFFAVSSVGEPDDGLYFAIIAPCSAGFLYFFFRGRSRIRFGAANLKVAAVAVNSMPQTIFASLCMGGIRLAWLVITIVAAAGSTHAFRSVEAPDGTYYPVAACTDVISHVESISTVSCECNGESVSSHSACQYSGHSACLVIFWCLSFLWSARVMNNVMTATVAGSVASWWFSPNDAAPVHGALYRATHASFGSLCKAAVLSGVVYTLRAVLNRLVRGICCLRFLLSWVQNAVDCALSYVVAFIGIYGLDFKEASSRVGELFRTRGITTLANDTGALVGLDMLAAFAIAFYAVVLFFLFFVLAMTTSTSPAIWPLVLVSVVIYLTVVRATLTVIHASFKTVFVCFVQDSEALAANHNRQYHSELSKAWEELDVLSLADGVRGEYQA